MQKKIFVVDDDDKIRTLLQTYLEKNNYLVESAADGESFLVQFNRVGPEISLVILDLMLPGIDGFDVCRALKQDKNSRNIPIIMLTARGEDTDIVSGLELGAEDYITKPFSPKILVARIRTVLRRSTDTAEIGEKLELNGISIDISRHVVTIDEKNISLSTTEFDILKTLMASPGWVFSRNQIINSVKGSDYPVTQRSVDVQILGLRKKLGDKGCLIETVRGVGYRLQGE